MYQVATVMKAYLQYTADKIVSYDVVGDIGNTDIGFQKQLSHNTQLNIELYVSSTDVQVYQQHTFKTTAKTQDMTMPRFCSLLIPPNACSP